MKAACTASGFSEIAGPLEGGNCVAARPIDGRYARAHSLPIHQHGAGAALRQAAAKLRSVKAQRIAQHIARVTGSHESTVTVWPLGLEAKTRHERPPLEVENRRYSLTILHKARS